jgi:hypothetical protein
MFIVSLVVHWSMTVNICRRNKASTLGLAIKFYASIQSVCSRVPAARWAETRAPDPARYAGQQRIEIKVTVLSELYVSLNNARGLMGVPRLA